MSGQATGSRLFALALIVAAASGCAALAHELLWTRRLVDLLGASSASSTRVFGCFFLGLSLGAAWSTRIVPRLQRPLRAVAIAEAGVALLTVPIWLLPHWTGWIWPALGPERLVGWQGGAVKLALSIVTVTAPAFLMGAVLPFLGAAVLRETHGLARHGVWLYAINTLGGVLGLALVIGVALDTLGASGTMLGAMALNVVVAAAALLLDRAADPVLPAEPPARRPRPDAALAEREGRVRRAALVVSFVSGAGVLALEVLSLELVMLRAPFSFQATSAVLSAMILLLAVASLVVPLLTPRPASPRSLLVGALASAAMMVVVTPPIFARVAMDPSWEAPAVSVLGFALRLTTLALLTLGPAMLLAGLVFPAVLAWSGTEGGDPHGRDWGALLAVNGLGAVVGAEGAYQVFLPALGVHQSVSVVAVLYALVALGLLVASGRLETGHAPMPRRRRAVTLMVMAAMLVVLGGYRVRSSPRPGVLEERAGREGTVRVIEHPRFGRGLFMNNHYLLGTSAGRWDEERQTHIPLTLHPSPRAFAHVGFGTGITPGAALAYPELESVTSLELSALVRDAAARHFREFNNRIAEAPHAAVVVEDGRTYLASTVDAFDVITGDVFLPWGRGEGRLFTIEHFQAVRAALRPGGVFCQWLPMHQLTHQQFELIAATFARVFPTVHLFQLTFYLRAPGLALVGFRDGDLSWDVVRERTAAARGRGVLDPVARHHEAVAMLYLGRWDPPASRPGADINTLDNIALELSAARERVSGDVPSKYLTGPSWVRFLRTRVTAPDAFESVSPPVRDLARLGVVATEYQAARDGNAAHHADRLLGVVQAQLPPAFEADRVADWSRWPGDRTLIR